MSMFNDSWGYETEAGAVNGVWFSAKDPANVNELPWTAEKILAVEMMTSEILHLAKSQKKTDWVVPQVSYISFYL